MYPPPLRASAFQLTSLVFINFVLGPYVCRYGPHALLNHLTMGGSRLAWLLVLTPVMAENRKLSHTGDPVAAAAVGGLGSTCADYSASCGSWATSGQCRSNRAYMSRKPQRRL
jgi:hypothetical protein